MYISRMYSTKEYMNLSLNLNPTRIYFHLLSKSSHTNASTTFTNNYLFFRQQHLKAVFEEALDKETVVKDMSGRVVKISSATLQTLEHIVKVLTYLYKDDLKYVTDYRMAVVKATVYTRNPNTVSNIKYMYLLYIICVHQVFCINFTHLHLSANFIN